MDDDAPHRMRWPRVFARVGGYMFLAVVLYVVSFGPASYLFLHRNDGLDRTLHQFYTPIVWLADNTGVMTPMIDYLLWWRKLPGGPIDRFDEMYATPAPQ